MAFQVSISFDHPEDLYDLLIGLTKPDPRLGTVLTRLDALFSGVASMNSELQSRLDTLTQRVASVDGAEQSVLALVTELRTQLTGLRDELASSGVDPAQLASLDALNAKLASETQQIADAVTGPAQPAPTPEPAPVPVVDPAAPTSASVDPSAPVVADPAAPGEGVPPGVSQPGDTVTIPPTPNPDGSTP